MTGAMRDRDAYVAANRAAWDGSAHHHRVNDSWRKLVAGFATPGYSCLDATGTAALAAIGVAGRAVAQLCCNNGRELLSIANMGAARCVGFDQSAAFLEQARELAGIAGAANCTFVAGDVYKIPPAHDGSFDLVVVTIGVFGWMPDLAAFLAVAARLLRPGGRLYVHEEHPLMNMFDPQADRPFEPAIDYFRTEPLVETNAIVYDGATASEVVPHYWFCHTLAEVFTGYLDNGLAIETFREYPNNISSVAFDIYEERATAMPMSYVLVARKQG